MTPLTYQGVETDQAGVSADLGLLCLVWAYPDEDQERGLTPGVTDLIMSISENSYQRPSVSPLTSEVTMNALSDPKIYNLSK